MDYFNYHNGILYAEGVNLISLAEKYKTPCYVYSRATLERHWYAFEHAFNPYPHLVCYSVKANSNLAILNLLARLGAGFDIVSGGELERVLRAGGQPGKVIFSGVGKTKAEMHHALAVGIRCFNVESEAELIRLHEVAQAMGKPAPVAIRVNPDVDAKTHPYISTGLKQNKFGIDIDKAFEIYLEAVNLPYLQVVGLDCHIGSQLTDTTPFVDALQRILILAEKLQKQGIHLQHLDLGGGLGVRYSTEVPPEPQAYVQALRQILGESSYQIIIEPGRAIVANAGILLTRVEYLKNTANKHFAIVDAAMNDLIRPALYQAWQEIVPVQPRNDTYAQNYDIVGPICETSDFLGKDRPLALEPGDLLAVRTAGAYGFVMSSNYNSRPRAMEIMVEGEQATVVRRRETFDEMLALESILDNK